MEKSASGKLRLKPKQKRGQPKTALIATKRSDTQLANASNTTESERNNAILPSNAAIDKGWLRNLGHDRYRSE